MSARSRGARSFGRIRKRWRDLGFRGKMIASYLIIALIPLTAGGVFLYNMSFQNQLALTQSNMIESVQRINQLIDVRLRRLYYSAISLGLNRDFLNLFAQDHGQEMDDYQRFVLRKKIGQSMREMLRTDDEDSACSVFVLTRDHCYDDGSGLMHIPMSGYRTSAIRKAVLRGDRRPLWIPTYDFVSMYDVPALKGVKFGYKKLFTFAHAFNLSYTYPALPPDAQAADDENTAVMLVNFSPDFYDEHFRGEWAGDGAVFYVHDDRGNIVSHGENALWGDLLTADWLSLTASATSGTGTVTLEDRRYLLCFARSSVTEWTTSVLFPYEHIARRIVPTTLMFVLSMAGIMLLLTAIIMPALVRMLTAPIKRLQTAILCIERGNYSFRLHETGQDELSELAHRFNEMSGKLSTLVHENYEVRLREREMEITSLYRQINPHFLYNTLNLLHFKAIASEQYEIDHYLIALSKMLEYTADTQRKLVPLHEELAWVERYMLIMASRFEGRFKYAVNVEPELCDSPVPKLFLQPLLENAIVHGLAPVTEGGMVIVRGEAAGDMRVFTVEDNGVGIRADRISGILGNEDGRIGVRNIHARIRLLYGERYGVEIRSEEGKGTRVFIRLPARV